MVIPWLGGPRKENRKIVNSLQTIIHWLTQSPFAAAAAFFGGTVVAVTLGMYFYDYTMLTNRDQVGK